MRKRTPQQPPDAKRWNTMPLPPDYTLRTKPVRQLEPEDYFAAHLGRLKAAQRALDQKFGEAA